MIGRVELETGGEVTGHVINIREVRLSAGAEFIVMICGDIMTMPGLPKVPAAEKIDIDDQGEGHRFVLSVVWCIPSFPSPLAG